MLLLLFSVITCQRPNLTSELHLTSNPFRQRFYFNESLSFFCSVGFHLQGSSIKYCTKTDDFQHDLPTCASKILRFHYFLFHVENMQISTFINKSKPVSHQFVYIISKGTKPRLNELLELFLQMCLTFITYNIVVVINHVRFSET